MAKNEQKPNTQPSPDVPSVAVSQQPTPNRERYASMFGEDNPDVDFNDKEARYARMADERESYRALRKSGSQLSQALDKNRWLAAMFQDLAENPEKNPLVWLTENGIDVRAALEDPAVMQQVDERFKNWQQRQVEAEAAEQAQNEAIAQSLETLAALQQEVGFSDEQRDRMWEHFWDEVFTPAFRGEVSKDTWTALLHAMNYDNDMKNAREEAAIQARNEKLANRVKTYPESKVPPSFSQGQGQRATAQKKKEGFFDDLRNYH